MRHTIYLAIALCLAFTEVRADFYRCKTAQGNVYSEKPCSTEQPGQKVNVQDAGNSSNRQELQERIAKDKFAVRKIDAIRTGQVIIGMTKEEVIDSWGHPHKINRTASSNSISEQWIYRRGEIGRDQYLYMENGKLRSFQSPVE